MTRGLCSDVLQLVVAEHEMIVGEAVLEELRRIFTRKFKLPQARVDAFIRFLSEFHSEPTPPQLPAVPIRDPDDLAVVACALSADADLIVTGDKDLLEIPATVALIEIVNPRTFWTRHRPEGMGG